VIELYASVREAALPHVPWDDATRHAFIEQQFAGQDAHYRQRYPGARLDVIEMDGKPARRLYVHRGPRDIRIIDIPLGPAYAVDRPDALHPRRGEQPGAATLRAARLP
jgi:hypothetical protein